MLNKGDSGSYEPGLVKFGGWDQSALASDLTVLKTRSSKSWALEADTVYINNFSFYGDQNYIIEFSPDVRNVFLPPQEWEQFAQQIQQSSSLVKCSQKACAYRKSCGFVTDFGHVELPININLIDSDNTSFTVNSKLGDYLVDKSSQECELPIYKGTDDNTWLIGTAFMDEYVWILDNTPFDEKGKDYNQVGIARKDKRNVFKEIENLYSVGAP